MTESLELIVYGLAAATAASFLLALMALVSARRVRKRLRDFERSLETLEQSMQSAAHIFAESDMRMNAACEEIKKLTVRQGAVETAGGQSGFKQAIALSRRGASVDELMDTCGISVGEARLILTMYGQEEAA